MSKALSISRLQSGSESVADEVMGIIIGVGFTIALFTGIAHFQDRRAESPVEEIEDLRQLTIPLDAPPPKEVQSVEAPAPPTPLMGVEIAASDSPVKIAVLAPDLAALMTDTQVAPSATIQPARFQIGAKPQMGAGEGDFQRVFQPFEVDQRPTVLARPNPRVPKFIRGNAKTLRVSLIVIIDNKGGVSSVRVVESSGNPEFDAIVISDVRQSWVFTPAVKKGRNVRCLLQQSVRVSWEAGSPFEG